jgi:hypothetical protein
MGNNSKNKIVAAVAACIGTKDKSSSVYSVCACLSSIIKQIS